MKPLVIMSDFGLADGAVSAMYGVAYSVCEQINISSLTHEIPQYNAWEASYRLIQTVGHRLFLIDMNFQFRFVRIGFFVQVFKTFKLCRLFL